MIYKCEVCGNEFDTISGAQACEDKHVEEEQKRMAEDQAKFDEEKAKADEIKADIEALVEDANWTIQEYHDLKASAQDLLDEYHKNIEEIRELMSEYKKIVPFSKTELSFNPNGIKVNIEGGFKDPADYVAEQKASVSKPIYPFVDFLKDIFERGI